ncbi:hypothetical protein AB1L42_12145 [Thalassoglobus sp. JC818]|uniref:hypothetical protein n=1 Tax=Thalassoglobus sp. JC818 TaxID=3232136 RepID=UPI003459B10B
MSSRNLHITPGTQGRSNRISSKKKMTERCLLTHHPANQTEHKSENQTFRMILEAIGFEYLIEIPLDSPKLRFPATENRLGFHGEGSAFPEQPAIGHQVCRHPTNRFSGQPYPTGLIPSLPRFNSHDSANLPMIDNQPERGGDP